MARILAASVLAAALAGLGASPALATIWQVNGASGLCNDAGVGTPPPQPFCTISKAASVAVAGDTVNVAAASYRETVIPPVSGVTYTGAPNARVLGTNNLSGAGLWTQFSGPIWSTPYNPPTNPRQVWRNDVRLLEVTTGTAGMVTNSFYYDAVAQILYVNVGGANPGNGTVEAGARSFGFDLVGLSNVVVQGFDVIGHNTAGMRVRTGLNVTLRSNRVSRARTFGISVEGTTTPSPITFSDGVKLESNEAFDNGDSGLRLRVNVVRASVTGNRSHHNRNHGLASTDTTDSWIAGNEFYNNLRPGGVSTTGLILDNGSHRNQVERNRSYANQDSGFQVNGTAGVVRNADNAFVRNIAHGNGDHGFDVRESDGTRVVSNTSYGNTNDGFSIEGNAAGTTLRNNIGVNNGLNSGGNDLWVDPSSTTGFSSDYDVWHNTVDAPTFPIEYNGVGYDTVAEFFAATGHEGQGRDTNPQFANAAGANFTPGIGGSAIDNADAGAAGFQALDFFGQAPVDIGSVANAGAGLPNFADRGAVELRDPPPVARLTVTPRRALRLLPVTADGSASTDDDKIVSYRFDFGDGTPAVESTLPIATHIYLLRGTYHVRLTVMDSAGQTNTKQVTIQVR